MFGEELEGAEGLRYKYVEGKDDHQMKMDGWMVGRGGISRRGADCLEHLDAFAG